ncbi:MAG: capsule biosynthesis protein [Mucilaginibacter sp.]|nr:capsule biosynthesis protein [Mucilaginibacter sp.]
MRIPFSPPFVDKDVIDEVVDTLNSGWITSGPKVKSLENEIAKLTECPVAICVNSWTSGAILMLKWFGVKEGDEVIVPAYTYSATALSVLHCGATPVMVDIEDDFTISPLKVKQAITNKTKVIMPVDFAGWPCDYDALHEVIHEAGIISLFSPTSEKQEKLGRILLISDAAHSIGATYKGRSAAVSCDVTILSLHAVKNITTAEGGCICLNLPNAFNIQSEFSFLKMYTLNGQSKSALEKSKAGGWKYDILFQGLKINMPDLNAAIGLAQIKKYKTNLLPLRKNVAMSYYDGFKSFQWFINPPLKDETRESSYHLFPLRIKGITETQRDKIVDFIMGKGIAVNVHFIPMPMMTLFKSLGYNIADFPNSYKNFAIEISLPIYPQLQYNQINYIIATVVKGIEIQLAEKIEG